MNEAIDNVSEKPWPKLLRKVVNRLVSRANRIVDVVYADVQTPEFQDGEDKLRLVLPRVIAGGGSSGLPGGYKCVASGASSIRVYFGVTNSVLTDGMFYGDSPAYIITPGTGAGVVCLAVVLDGDGDVESCNISTHADPPDDTGDTFYLLVGSFTSESGQILVTPGGAGNGVGDQQFELCGGIGGTPLWGPA